MNASRTMTLFLNPFLMWSRLVWKAGEMSVAAAQVVGHRTTRLAQSGPVPSAQDRQEFALMGREKAEAVMESAQAAGLRLLMLNQQCMALAFKQMTSVPVALLAIAGSRSPAESLQRQSKLVRDMMTDTVMATSKLSGSTAQVARRALKPVHTRVSANVRRLGKR
jgi:hypothetical protein